MNQTQFSLNPKYTVKDIGWQTLMEMILTNDQEKLVAYQRPTRRKIIKKRTQSLGSPLVTQLISDTELQQFRPYVLGVIRPPDHKTLRRKSCECKECVITVSKKQKQNTNLLLIVSMHRKKELASYLLNRLQYNNKPQSKFAGHVINLISQNSKNTYVNRSSFSSSIRRPIVTRQQTVREDTTLHNSSSRDTLVSPQIRRFTVLKSQVIKPKLYESLFKTVSPSRQETKLFSTPKQQSILNMYRKFKPCSSSGTLDFKDITQNNTNYSKFRFCLNPKYQSQTSRSLYSEDKTVLNQMIMQQKQKSSYYFKRVESQGSTRLKKAQSSTFNKRVGDHQRFKTLS